MTTLGSPPRARRGATEYHHGDLRQALLDAAQDLLISAGIEAVGMREIARRVGVSHAAPYRHYASREALLADLAASGYRELDRRFAHLPTIAEPEARFIAMAVIYVEFAREQPQVWRLMFGDSLDKSEYPHLLQVSQAVFGTLQQNLLTLGVAAPATTEALAAWAMAHGVARLVLDHRLDAHPDLAIEPRALVEAAAGIFLAGLRASG
ncbi:MAG: TetR/AcrR family transcriptional regulator [Dokdonella sp.]|uniref:TetR/AcrR family transcriptional regulator n=1 Tax=Dokdonella sp. TaxID=2291710 RepID=UPI0025B888AB|nr:TetR/AcrR family transcriptional regulator [Dokdonella sp.]MBZ0221787.1 TetR/AcrR family transcriptional regulator [Dokdonella sp.]MCC7255225.1 TetR/AcrR family transcriptional regulator [Dokdonella sp.]